MSLYRNGISPSRHLPTSPHPPPLRQPLGYIIDSPSPPHRKRDIKSLKDLRGALHAQTDRERLFVVYDHDARVLDVLGVEAPCVGRRRKGVGECPRWMWEYPDMQNASDGRSVTFCTCLLVKREGFWILLVDSPSQQERGSRYLPPRLKHQDATTRTSNLRTPYYHEAPEKKVSLEEDLCRCFGEGEGLEEVLGELIFERWLTFLDGLSNKDCACRKERVLYRALQSLERNQDMTRSLIRQSQPVSTPGHQDLSDALTRVHRHITLLPQPSSSSSPSLSSAAPNSERSLNRISYLGGLLLPITVVSSVLAIEGDYGPEGNNFWVFWVAAAVASLVAVGLIHVDEVRGVEVWREVAEEFGILGDEGDGDRAEERGVRDGHGLVWERRVLGWGGAVKKVSGYYRVRGMKGMKFDRPDGRRY